MSKRFLIILGVLVLGFFGVIVLSKDKDSGGSNGSSDHTFGKGQSGVTVVEFGDFQCPACGKFYPIVNQVKENYEDKITFQFRHYPLVNIHPNAMAAHRAAEAAGKQGKFWEMHDFLYERQASWQSSTNPSKVFEDYAAELGINVDKFKEDAASQTVSDIINNDVKAAQEIGATGTPTFVIDGKKLDQLPNSYEEFSKLIDEAIANKQ